MAANLPLTRREAEVLRWLSLGKTNRDIGKILGISIRTIDKHIEHIFNKLEVETRTAAALKFNAGQSSAAAAWSGIERRTVERRRNGKTPPRE